MPTRKTKARKHEQQVGGASDVPDPALGESRKNTRVYQQNNGQRRKLLPPTPFASLWSQRPKCPCLGMGREYVSKEEVYQRMSRTAQTSSAVVPRLTLPRHLGICTVPAAYLGQGQTQHRCHRKCAICRGIFKYGRCLSLRRHDTGHALRRAVVAFRALTYLTAWHLRVGNFGYPLLILVGEGKVQGGMEMGTLPVTCGALAIVQSGPLTGSESISWQFPISTVQPVSLCQS